MTNEDKKASNEAETFDWAELREALDRDKHGVRHLDKVTDREKFVNLMMENPLIPIGK